MSTLLVSGIGHVHVMMDEVSPLPHRSPEYHVEKDCSGRAHLVFFGWSHVTFGHEQFLRKDLAATYYRCNARGYES